MTGELLNLGPFWWVAHSRLFETNSGIFASQGRAVLIDPGIYPDEIDRQKSFLDEASLSLQAILLTHSHWDHILGPERLPEAAIIAQARFSDVAASQGTAIRAEIAAWETEHNLARQQAFAIPIQDLTFTDQSSLQVGGAVLHLLAAPGHAADQCAAYHPESGTLWAADMLSDLEIPFVSHNLAAYRRTLESLSSLEIRALVPGHGHATQDPAEIWARLAGDRAYLDELYEGVAESLKLGRSLEEAQEACASIFYRQPSENGGPHHLNVSSAYIELGGAVSDPGAGWG